MLKGTANADGDVDFGFDRFARSAHLAVLWKPLFVNHRAAARKGGPQSVGQFLNRGDVLWILDASPHRDENIGLGDVHVPYGGLHIFQEPLGGSFFGKG